VDEVKLLYREYEKNVIVHHGQILSLYWKNSKIKFPIEINLLLLYNNETNGLLLITIITFMCQVMILDIEIAAYSSSMSP